MAKNKTIQTESSVHDYLAAITDEQRKKDCTELVSIVERHTGFEPKMWGSAIIGFGSYHYVYESGHEGDAPIIGLSSRANAITLYIRCAIEGMEEKMKHLGKCKQGKGCIYIKSLNDINTEILCQMITISIDYIKNKYPQ